MSETKKPRICKVLSVAPGQEWTVRGDEYDNAYRISLSGSLQMRGADGRWTTTGIHTTNLAIAINRPDSIIRKPCWTPEDIKAVEAIRLLYPDSKFVRRVKMADGRFATDIVCENGIAIWVPTNLVISLEAGEKVALDEILEAEHG